MNLDRCSLTISIAAAAMLTGCGGSQSPIAAPGAITRASEIVTHADRGKSWMAPEAKSDDLLYVGKASYPSYGVFVYDYKTEELLGNLGGFDFYEPSGMCVDKPGNVWITSDYTSQVVEYAHGGVDPIQILSTNGTPIGCSVSPSGDLAVTNHTTPSGPGDIQVWKRASGTPTSYSDPSACYLLWPAGYDNKGDLYVESQGQVCELPAGASTLGPIAFNQAISYPSSTMWDGKYITLADQKYMGGYNTGVYRAAPTASGGLKFVGGTPLGSYGSCSGPVSQPFFVGKKNTPANDEQAKVAVGNLDCYNNTWMVYYRYKSGAPFKTFKSALATTGQAVSLARR